MINHKYLYINVRINDKLQINMYKLDKANTAIRAENEGSGEQYP
jgi:hypothetical protein